MFSNLPSDIGEIYKDDPADIDGFSVHGVMEDTMHKLYSINNSSSSDNISYNALVIEYNRKDNAQPENKCAIIKVDSSTCYEGYVSY